MKNLIILLFLSLFSHFVFSQDNKVDSSGLVLEDTLIEFIEDLPAPIIGFPAFYEFIKQHLVYPNHETKEGKVYLKFTVQKDGQLSNFEVLKGLGQAFDAEALRVLNLSPKWKPRSYFGRVVESKFIMPIIFKKP